MRLVIQRVKSASVSISDVEHAKINKGLLVFVGVEEEDDFLDIQWLVGKLVKMRLFPDEKHPINASIEKVEGEFLIISQFTLHASTKKGNRPSFVKSASPERAKKMYEDFIEHLKNSTKSPVKTGVFGASMDIQLTNHGPVTILIDSKHRE